MPCSTWVLPNMHTVHTQRKNIACTLTVFEWPRPLFLWHHTSQYVVQLHSILLKISNLHPLNSNIQ